MTCPGLQRSRSFSSCIRLGWIGPVSLGSAAFHSDSDPNCPPSQTGARVVSIQTGGICHRKPYKSIICMYVRGPFVSLSFCVATHAPRAPPPKVLCPVSIAQRARDRRAPPAEFIANRHRLPPKILLPVDIDFGMDSPPNPIASRHRPPPAPAAEKHRRK